MSTKELIKTYTYDDIHTDRRGERVKVVKGRTVIELGTKAATSFVGNLYRVYDYSVKSYKQLLLVGVAKQPLCSDFTDSEFEDAMHAFGSRSHVNTAAIFVEYADTFVAKMSCRMHKVMHHSRMGFE